ncbi:hypothetical protein A0J61_10587, partial [Choanephora cucurbitarum]
MQELSGHFKSNQQKTKFYLSSKSKIIFLYKKPSIMQLSSSISSTTLEFELVMEALTVKVRLSTSLAYRTPLEHWKKRTCKKIVSMMSGVCVKIVLEYTEAVEEAESSLSLIQMAENDPSTKDGKKFPSERRDAPWPSPKKTKQLIDLLKNHVRDLIYDQVNRSANRAAHCVIRGSYKSGGFIRILKSLWDSSSRTSLKEMFSISSRHHMLLRDQDLRNLNFADCFCT